MKKIKMYENLFEAITELDHKRKQDYKINKQEFDTIKKEKPEVIVLLS